MTKRAMRAMAVAGLALAAMSGCSYPIAKVWRDQAARGVTFRLVQTNPDAFKGKIVIWGGSIIETANLAKGSELLVLHAPLDSWEEPLPSRHSQGRFIVRAAGFLDPMVYRTGRRITVAGEVAGKEDRPIGKVNYAYPVLDARQLYLWPRYREVYYPYYYPPYYDWGWYGPPGWGYAPHWGWWYGPP